MRHTRPLFGLALAVVILLSAPFHPLGQAQPQQATAPVVEAVPGPGPGQLTLQWPESPPGSPPVTGYTVYRGARPDALVAHATTPVTTFVDGCVGHGQTWYYRVAAQTSGGEGPLSDLATAISGAPPTSGDHVALLGARLPSPRAGTAAVWTGQYAFVFGGEQGTEESIVRFDPLADCAVAMDEELDRPSVQGAATWDGTYAYIIGGTEGPFGALTDDIIRYDPQTDEDGPLAENLPSARAGMSAVFALGQHLVFGGMAEGPFGAEETTEVVDVLDEAVQAELPEPRTATSAILAGSRAFVFGGANGNYEWPQVFEYDLNARTSRTLEAQLPHEGIRGSAAAFDGQYGYVLGGLSYELGPVDEIQRFQPPSAGRPAQMETLGSRLPAASSFASAVWDGRHVYLFGGENDVDVLDTVVRYTPPLLTERAPPQAVAASRGPGAGQISLSWHPPADAVGLTGYRLYRGLTPFTTILHGVTGTTPSFTDVGLVEGQEWCYRVTALFGSVESRITGAVCSKAPDRPSAPRAVSATAGANVGDVNVSWQPPADTGGISLQGYRLFRNGVALPDIQGLSFVDSGRPAWTALTYTVRAINAVGEGAPSNSATTWPASVPSAPLAFSAGGNGPGVARLTWNIPAVLGTDALLGYRVYRTWPGHAERWADEVGLSPLIWQDSDLPKGTFAYRLTAVNKFGEGPSTPTTDVEVRVLPDRPVLSGRPVGVGQIRLEWDLADDGGAPIVHFQVYRSLEADKVGDLVATTDAAARGYTDLVGVPTNYYYSVVVNTGVGDAISFQERVYLPPVDCAALPACIDSDQLCGSLDNVDYDGDLLPDCLDDDIDGDHLHNDLESDLLLNPRNPHSDRNLRSSTDMGDGLEDQHDPRPAHKDRFAVAVELVDLCIKKEWDFVPLRGHLAPADPYLGPNPTLLTTSAENPELALEFNRLRQGNHYHNKFCINEFAGEPTEAIRSVPLLPRNLLTDWEWTDGALNVPQIRIRMSFVDHDTSGCPIIDPDHDCVENVRGDDHLGYLTEQVLWGLTTLRWPAENSVPIGRLDSEPLTQELVVTSPGPGPITLRVRAQTNMGGCDLVTSILGKSYPPVGQDPARIATTTDFVNANEALEGFCSKVRAEPGPLP